MRLPTIEIQYPGWVVEAVDWDRRYESDEERMRLAIAMARKNVVEDGGGPFGAAIFERESGQVVAVGMNRVVPANNSVLHAEIVAFMMAQAKLQSYSLRAPGLPTYELATSCEPCAMCLGAALWSGVSRIVCGATKQDAERLNFDEGPVFPESYEYLRARGIDITFEVCREEAAEVMNLYRQTSGVIYNA